MSAIISAISNLVTAAASWISVWAKWLVGYTPAASESGTASWNPGIQTLFLLIPLVGLGIGLLRRLINVN